MQENDLVRVTGSNVDAKLIGMTGTIVGETFGSYVKVIFTKDEIRRFGFEGHDRYFPRDCRTYHRNHLEVVTAETPFQVRVREYLNASR